MIELPSWASTALDVLYYAVSNPVWILLVAVAGLVMIFVAAYPIWCAIRGRGLDEGRGVEPLHPIMRLVLALIGLGLLWSFVAPWL